MVLLPGFQFMTRRHVPLICLHPPSHSLGLTPVTLTLRRTESLSLQAAGSTVLIG